MYFGDILIPYVEKLSTKNISKNVLYNVSQKNGVTLNSEYMDRKSFGVSGTICNYENKDVDDIAEDAEALMSRDGVYNKVSYNNIKGFLSVESGNVQYDVNSLLARDYEFNGIYFPLSEYQSGYDIQVDYITNDYNIEFPPYIALPVNAYNVRVKNAWDSILLTSYGKLSGRDGNLKIYQPYPVFDELNYNNSTSTGDSVYLESAHGCISLNLNTLSECIIWNIDIGVDLPKGLYKVVARVRDGNITDDIKISVIDSNSTNIISETFTTGSSNWVALNTSQFQLYNNETISLKIEKSTSNANTIEIDYVFLIPETNTTLLYDCNELYDYGEVKIFDSCGEADSDKWKQIYGINHNFSAESDIIIENSLFRWRINLSDYWGVNGLLQNLNNNQIGRLYPLAFSNNKVNFHIKTIKPDIVEILFYMVEGDSDYNADSAKEIAYVKIYPHIIIFELNRYGNFNSDWIIDWSESSNYIGSYCTDTQFVSISSNDLNYTSKNSAYLSIFDDNIFVFAKSINENSTIKNDGGFITLSSDYEGNYMFSLSDIYGFNGSSYLLNSASKLFDVDEILTLNTMVSSYDSTMFSSDLENYASWNWDTDHVNIVSGDSDTNSIKILKSYEYSDISSYKLDIKINDVGTVDRECGLIFAYKDSLNYYYVTLKLDSSNDAYIKIYKYVDGVSSEIGNTSISSLSVGFNTLDIEIIDDNINVYIYEIGTGRSNAEVCFVTDTSLTKLGNVGICVLSDTVDHLDVDIKNLLVSGDNLYNRGVPKNTIIDDLNWNTLNEYIVNEGTFSKWSNNDEDLCFDVVSNDSVLESITMKNLSLGSGVYSCQLKINSESAAKRECGFIFASEIGDYGLYYSLVVELDSSGNAYLNLKKWGSAFATIGTYGVGGYALYGYGGDSGEVILAQDEIDYTVGDWVVIECIFNNETHSFDCYYRKKGEERTFPNMSYIGDTQYIEGEFGLVARTDDTGTDNINASFKYSYLTEITETDSIDGQFVTTGGVPHGSLFNDIAEITALNTQLTVLENAKYNSFIRTKITDGSTSLMDFYFENQTQSTTLSLQTSNYYENVTPSTTWVIQNEILNIDSNNYGDIGYIGIKRTNETVHNKPLCLIDFISLIPINVNNDSEYIFPFDLIYDTFNDNLYNGKIEKREYTTKLIERINAGYNDLNYTDI